MWCQQTLCEYRGHQNHLEGWKNTSHQRGYFHIEQTAPAYRNKLILPLLQCQDSSVYSIIELHFLRVSEWNRNVMFYFNNTSPVIKRVEKHPKLIGLVVGQWDNVPTCRQHLTLWDRKMVNILQRYVKVWPTTPIASTNWCHKAVWAEALCWLLVSSKSIVHYQQFSS